MALLTQFLHGRGFRFLVALGATCIIYLLIWSLDASLSYTKEDATDARPLHASLSHGKEDAADAKILLVSAYFPLPRSKHTHKDYAGWLRRYLTKVTTHIYFFAPPEAESMIRKLRGDLPMTLNTSFSSPFDTPPFKDLRGRYEEMHNEVPPDTQIIDWRKETHSPELYAVWNAKTYFLHAGLQNSKANGFNPTWTFWNDAGSFRDGQELVAWPDPRRLAEIFQDGSRLTGTRVKDLFFMPVWNGPNDDWKGWQEDDGPVHAHDSFSEGSFFGGHEDAVSWWYKAFFAYHDHYLFKHKGFLGVDQNIFSSLFLLFPERFITVWQNDNLAPEYVGPSWDHPLGNCGPSPWWYYQFFVSNEQDKAKMWNLWSPGEPIPTKFNPVIPKTSTLCRITRVLDMKHVIRRKLGMDWEPPCRRVDLDVSQRDY